MRRTWLVVKSSSDVFRIRFWEIKIFNYYFLLPLPWTFMVKESTSVYFRIVGFFYSVFILPFRAIEHERERARFMDSLEDFIKGEQNDERP